MAAISCSGYAHIRLNVTDIARSTAFYDELFGWPKAIDNSAAVGEPGVSSSPEQFYGGVIYLTPGGTLFGLRPVAPAGQRFDSGRVGLDHVSFAVRDRAELESAAAHFAERGVEHGEITDLAAAGMTILSFTDPDGIHGELTAPLS